ncbi:hypothetical protein AAK964_10330 [Tissierella praeacuta]|uniref:hypothetical protein n=1 Tax=Tissierella praeacuta TaxID=43131 RepID=UPI003511073D
MNYYIINIAINIPVTIGIAFITCLLIPIVYPKMKSVLEKIISMFIKKKPSVIKYKKIKIKPATFSY